MTIRQTRLTRIATLAALTLTVTSAPLSAAQLAPGTQYLVTATITRAEGPVTSSDVLVVTPSGVSMSAPNAAVQTCFSTAAGILNEDMHPQPGAALEVSFNGNAVAVPLQMTSSVLANGFTGIAVNGSVEGAFDSNPQNGIAIVVAGNVVANKSELVGAQFRETSVDVATKAPIAQAMCTIARVIALPTNGVTI
jgi:hypothetical protein